MSASRTQLLPPSPALAPYVQAIAVRRPSLQGPALPAVQCFPANVLGALTVLHHGDWVDADTGRSLGHLELAGPRLKPARRRYANDPAITTVLLRPGVLNWLFDMPAADWVERRRPADELIGMTSAREFWRWLRSADGTAAQVWVIEQQLQAWVDQAQARSPWAPPPEVPAALSVGDWAETALWSARHLQRLVGDRLGLSPKALLRIERLQQSLKQLASGAPLADVATRCGFSHAAHMVREFRALAGLSPAGVRRDLARHEGLPWRLGDALASAQDCDQAFTQST
ncbi:MAG TPA: helix-turn-helix domain-containing protein [Roseateles sp.]